MAREHTIFYGVDVQHDFMDEDGRLPVPAAEEIKTTIGELNAHAIGKGYRRMASMDRHFADDQELERNGGPFPEHCMDASYGQRAGDGEAHGLDLLEEMLLGAHERLHHKTAEGGAVRTYAPHELEAIAARGLDVVVEKQHYDVATNPAFAPLIERMGVKEAVVYGVATDYCDKAAVLSLQGLGVQTYLVTDAIRGIDERGSARALEEMVEAGARLLTAADAYRRFP